MKALKTVIVVMLILLVTILLVQAVEARHHGVGSAKGKSYYGRYAHAYAHSYYGYYGKYGYGQWGYPYRWGYPYWRGRWGYPYWWDYSYWWDYPYYDPYYYGGYGEPPVPPQGVTPPAASWQQPPSYWYFCQNPEGYYPYVKNCPGGWMTVVPSKPNAPPPSALGAPPVSPPQ